MKKTFDFLRGVVAVLTMAFAGCATKPADPVTVENTVEVSATVEAVDVKKRLLSLRNPEGVTRTIEVPGEVRNLSQVKVGDKLVVRYQESLAAALKAPDKNKGSVTGANTAQVVGAARAEQGAKPGAAIGSVTTTTVTIQSVDKKSHTVMFSGEDGYVRVIPVKDPAAQKFVDTLKEGDQVELTYTEALALSIETGK